MFKPGDEVMVRSSGTLGITVKRVRKDDSGIVETSHGNFQESELHQAHQTVLDTMQAKKQDPLPDLAESYKEERKEVPWETREKLVVLLEKAKLEPDFHGHWKDGKGLYDIDGFARRMARIMGFGITQKDCEELIEVLEYNKKRRKKSTRKTLDRWISFGDSFGISTATCSYCGEDEFKVETDGRTIRIAGEPCSVPNGFEPNVWELNVPSGKLVVENSLGNWFPLPEGDHDCDINTVKGSREYTQLHASIGLSFGFVGNSCPGVFKLSNDSYKIANSPLEEDWDDKKKEWVEVPLPEDWEGEQVTSICTDLWWYSICDYEELERRFEHFGNFGIKNMSKFTVIDIKPGVYQFCHYDDVNRDAHSETLYANFKWIREPDPVKDFLTAYKELPDVNTHAYVQRQVKQWPTLFGRVKRTGLGNKKVIPWKQMSEEQQHCSWQRVADQVFFTNGNGIAWHENGHPTEKVTPGISDIEPPSFRYQASWHPFSDGYGGIFDDVKLNNSFAKLAMRCLESVMSFGTRVNDDARGRDVQNVRQRMLMAVNRYREMMALYPEAAEADYVWWLSQEGRAEAWVEGFELGPKKTQRHIDAAKQQRWVPEDAYAIEFDARKLKSGQFTGACGWASKDSATGFAIEEWSDNDQEDPVDNCCWTCQARRTAVPLYSVAKVVKVGEISHMGNSLVELSYEYGNEWMQSSSVRKAVEENTHKAGIRVLTKEQYEKLLPKATQFFANKAK